MVRHGLHRAPGLVPSAHLCIQDFRIRIFSPRLYIGLRYPPPLMSIPPDIIGTVKLLQRMTLDNKWTVGGIGPEHLWKRFPAIAQALLDREERLQAAEKALQTMVDALFVVPGNLPITAEELEQQLKPVRMVGQNALSSLRPSA